MANDRQTDFIVRYKEAFTREECRKIIEQIDFFDENRVIILCGI